MLTVARLAPILCLFGGFGLALVAFIHSIPRAVMGFVCPAVVVLIFAEPQVDNADRTLGVLGKGSRVVVFRLAFVTCKDGLAVHREGQLIGQGTCVGGKKWGKDGGRRG